MNKMFGSRENGEMFKLTLPLGFRALHKFLLLFV